ncbi:MAG: family 10 glycosylhydrolase [Kiritimatiellia bacterium]
MVLRIALLFVFLFLTLSLRAAQIAVVYAVRSVPVSEQRFAKALAEHIQRWYVEVGIDADLLPDTQLTSTTPQKLFILTDCYAPTESFVSAVRARLADGAKFVVCYSSSEALARTLGLRIGTYKRSMDGAWSSMSLLGNRPAGAPPAILQTSTNLFTVAPLSESSARPMAWWCDRSGKTTEVAWWKTSQGSYWMTHVLSGDGDEEGKQRLLLAIAAESIHGIWQTAARTLYREAAKPLTDGSLMARIKMLPKTSPRRQSLDNLYRQLQVQQERVTKLLSTDHVSAYTAVCDLRDVTARAYGMTYWSRPNEICGVWDHTGQGLYPGDWKKTAKLLAASGITDIYVNVAGAAFARYPSSILPRAKVAGDCLTEAVAAGHQYGLRVHAWILSFSCELASAETIADFRRKGWLLQDVNGKDLSWLDPTNPAVRAYFLSAVKEMATHTNVDGIHLDFIRYPGLQQTLGPKVRARFEATTGKSSRWPDSVTRGKSATREAFLQWRAERITDAVANVHTWMKRERPKVQLSVAVYGKYPACVDSVGQDWLSWLRTGLVDYALPMNYTEDLTTLGDWIGTQTKDPRLASRIVSGIGVTAAESRLSPIDVLHQIDIARKSKCSGFALFDLDETLRKKILPILSQGVTKR